MLNLQIKKFEHIHEVQPVRVLTEVKNYKCLQLFKDKRPKEPSFGQEDNGNNFTGGVAGVFGSSVIADNIECNGLISEEI